MSIKNNNDFGLKDIDHGHVDIYKTIPLKAKYISIVVIYSQGLDFKFSNMFCHWLVKNFKSYNSMLIGWIKLAVFKLFCSSTFGDE